ncbi:type I-E CRISPR-associated protein Cas6/Cse3/CasE [Aerococcus urinae]|uniref:Type I-E CRISPR-associated protein Cas6/Cse3/CasE n=1 Tax=Aerococcus mictus TaxID=2976810 RepID=A0A1E9PFL4_9LACT|nr:MULTISPECIES: type I-E CRISPR-associated protein Cas6/Cse3/CasE [Aerococcus]KAA9291676.1 type I-E CRISPR-associated protein Cas6/Cse3/CasE [Aerococcus mictus]MBU5609558.1 type I-E CRISPR-associated protein Cas6/Cse3/CasE [Aerococcus urinae]MCY3033576.1 type I-E CRISPR-associated protein Cas6/Cse3/CasE [Aerococcus mictus]MCY3062865.1 type I-E CRISPR-associated protein Cas6/Cse3/CasE [Aerococcus mictus]MCY3065379.1 type I-E CRISPR-associated protein Cas6/Cse3/CasE [Aerococcus mictus]
MYMSRVAIDTKNPMKMRSLNHLGAYHNWVESSFPEEFDANIRTRKLWRIDKVDGQEYLLIVSPSKPNREALEKYGITGSAQVADYSSFLNNLEEGMEAQFRVRLNPVVSESQPGKKRGRVVPLYGDEKQLNFLLDRDKKNGFQINPVTLCIVEKGFEPVKKRNEATIKLSSATYEGVLKITDLNQFKQTLKEGFGRKKAYGFGLMTIIPMR